MYVFDLMCEIKIQSNWRGRRTRYKLKYFSALPGDVWNIICYYMRSKTCIERLDNVILLRVIRSKWSPIGYNEAFEISTLKLIRTYFIYLSRKTQQECLCLLTLIFSSNNACTGETRLFASNIFEEIITGTNDRYLDNIPSHHLPF